MQSPHFQSGRCLNHRCKNESKTCCKLGFSEQKFKNSVKKSFLDTGTMFSADFKFTPYKKVVERQYGTLKVNLPNPEFEFEIGEDEMIDNIIETEDGPDEDFEDDDDLASLS